ncbi:hypothetical protein LV84_02757 [Algoriphagus ratkowskyi]|uniref:Uncharacterized protein n=1 Tax=Algoriphagus ratkowskyi TaxID=57028 RepID=A0A2W7R234_9BACT|nr:hypothetical protein [Algoriphagus ratkowskyi]PZX54604.1 hypothetical protein LV84_02757 [Algoriphagus ratkowskyi]
MEKNKTKKNDPAPAEEWDLSSGMGILPDDVPFTQNIGCVGGKTKKPANTSKKSPK